MASPYAGRIPSVTELYEQGNVVKIHEHVRESEQLQKENAWLKAALDDARERINELIFENTALLNAARDHEGRPYMYRAGARIYLDVK